ncbi:MAG: NmrA family NAD(P)-binding protein [Methyloligellaceae bacterium]
MKAKILITGAAGRTGAAAVYQLLEMGYPVRAFVRKDDHRAAQLRSAGAEIFIGSLHDFSDLQKAMTGIQRAYHCPPFAPSMLQGAMLFALAAEEAKLEVVALLSGWNPHPLHPSITTRDHWIANNIFRWMPSVDVIHINPGLFAFVYLLGLPAIKHFGMLMMPAGTGKNAPPSNEDIARTAVGALVNPAPHIGKCYRPTGPKLLSPQDIAGTLGHILGRKVKYQDAPMKMFLKAVTAQGFPKFEIAQVRYFMEELKNGVFATGAPTDHVEMLSGRKPEDFETIARRYIANPSLVHPDLQTGTMFQAIKFLIKMMMTRVPDLDAWERDQNHPALKNPQLAHESSIWKQAAENYRLHLNDNKVHLEDSAMII